MDRMCVSCDSTTTYMDQNGWPNWRFHDGYWLCKKCYTRYVANPVYRVKWGHINDLKYRGRKIQFRDQIIILSEAPRKGVCELCHRSINKGEIKRTNMHHMEYHDDDPLKSTIELCVGCHNKQHKDKYLIQRQRERDNKGRFTSKKLVQD